MNNIKAVVFDMDGLMIDTERLWVESVLQAGRELNYKIEENYIITIAGLRKDLYDAELQQHLGEGCDVAKVRERANNIFSSKFEKGELKSKKGVNELISYLKNKGLILAIASSSEKSEVEHRLKLVDIDAKFFDNIIGGDMVKKAKPDPEIYAMSCQVLGIEPKFVLALEDSEFGVEAAGRAGLVPIHIPDLKPSTENSKKYAYKTLESLFDVIDLFENKKD